MVQIATNGVNGPADCSRLHFSAAPAEYLTTSNEYDNKQRREDGVFF
jgi:hypothetical protein